MEKHGGNIYKIEREYNIKRGDILDFSSNINPRGISEKIREKIINSIDLIKNYPDPNYLELTAAVSDYHEIPGYTIIPGNGATELIYLYTRVLKPQLSLIIAPTFSEYEKALFESNSKIDYFQLHEHNEFKFDLPDLIQQMRSGYDFIVICNPNNPTGKFIGLETIKEIVHYAAKTGSRIMIDESFIEFIEDNDSKTSIVLANEYQNLFVLRSLTKFFALPGLRLGYAVSADKDFNSILNKMKEPWTINVLAEQAAVTMFKDKDFIKESRALIHNERKYMCNVLNKINWLKPYKSDVNFILLKILSNLSSHHLREQLVKDKILIRDASNFQFLDSKYIRIAVKDRESNKVLVEKLGGMQINQVLEY